MPARGEQAYFGVVSRCRKRNSAERLHEGMADARRSGDAAQLEVLQRRQMTIEAEELDRLTDEEAAQRVAYQDWLRRRQVECARRGVLAIGDADGVAVAAGADGFPVTDPRLPPGVIEEAGQHVLTVSVMGPTRPRRSVTSRGPATPSTVGGNADSASVHLASGNNGDAAAVESACN
jgi:hypothetical protein